MISGIFFLLILPFYLYCLLSVSFLPRLPLKKGNNTQNIRTFLPPKGPSRNTTDLKPWRALQKLSKLGCLYSNYTPKRKSKLGYSKAVLRNPRAIRLIAFKTDKHSSSSFVEAASGSPVDCYHASTRKVILSLNT